MIRESINRYGATARAGVALLALLLIPAFAQGQSVADKYQRARERQSAFNLSASPSTVLSVNKFQCGLRSQGDTCTDVFNSPTGGGGFWPAGSPDQYMFNSGIWVLGIIPAAENFEWAGDTVGAFFMDASGLRAHGTPVTDIYDSQNPDDLANWPGQGTFPDFPEASAWVEDADIFNDVLLGRKAASQQDSWVMYWDGDPGPIAGRDHPMGILVQQRTLAWNYPTGNESIVYLIYKFTNVTNNALFQRLNETKFFGGANALPDAGWRFDSIYAAYDADPDVTADAGQNYGSGILPFSLGIAYDGTFNESSFDYPPDLFYPPFFTAAPGIVGMKFLKSPIDPATGKEVGLTALSLHTNGGAFTDPNSVQRGWRYASLNVDQGKGDPNCTFGVEEIKARRACYLGQTQSDVRLFIASGPFSLDPGQSATIAVAMYAAATVSTPLITLTGDNKPGIPSVQPGCNGNPIRPIEIAAGWVSTNTADCPTDPNEVLSQFSVNVVPNSLLGKALVAQSIFDNKFLLGFAPESPTFYLVPGDNQITVVWEPSATEQTGDPFFAAAGSPTKPDGSPNALYDPNYRQFDVEGYRIYRGTSPSNMKIVAQFDKAGSVFEDHLCVTDPTFVQGDVCDPDNVNEVDITGPFIQYPLGGVVRLSDGTPLVVKADTAFQDLINAGNAFPLSNTGIPFAYVDKDVRNGFQYFYKVTAFDINSLRSGPSSLESAGPAKSTTTRAPGTTLTDAAYSFGLFGRGSDPLTGSAMAIDPVTGEFSGKAPPTDLLSGAFVPFAPQLLPAGTYQVRIDSVVGYYYEGEFFLTVTGQSGEYSWYVTSNEGESTDLPVISVPSEASVRQQLISQGVDAPPVAGSMTSSLAIDRWHFQSNDNDWAFEVPGFWSIDPPNTVNGGSRWYSGDNESTPDPTAGKGTAGSLPGVTTIFHPMPYMSPKMANYNGLNSDYMRRFYQTAWAMHRAADMRIYWGANGPDSVIDLTYDVPVQFNADMRATYGFLTDADGDGVLTYGDFWHLPHLCEGGTPNIGGQACNLPVGLVQQPVVAPTDATGDLASDGSGFGIYIAGEPYLFVGSVPTSGTWTLRTYAGSVTGESGSYAFTPTGENPGVPGLTLKLEVESPAVINPAVADLNKVHTVPDPYYAVSQFDLSPAQKDLKFVNLPAQATIRIYSMSGVLVTMINHNDPTGGGQETWNLRNRSNQFVGSGVYFFHVSTPDGKSHVGKFTVVNSGFAR